MIGGCLFDPCPPQSWADWAEPGLYAFLMEHAEIEARRTEAPGIAWDAPANWSAFSLRVVNWFPGLDRMLYLGEHSVTTAGWSFGVDLNVTVARPLNHSVEPLHAEFDDLLANLTTLEPPTRDQLWETLLASKEPVIAHLDRDWKEHVGYSFHVVLPSTPRLSERILHALASPDHAVADTSPAHRGLSNSTWSFGFEAPTATITGTSAVDGFSPQVGANDRVHLVLPRRLADNETGSRAWIAERLQDVGFRAPGFDDWRFTTPVC